MKLTKFAQSTLLIETSEGSRVLIDPGKYNFENGYNFCKELSPVDVLIITHQHEDHFDLNAVLKIAASSTTNLQILTTAEVAAILKNYKIAARVFKWGSEFRYNEFRLYSIRTDHVVQGKQIDAFGVIMEKESKKESGCSIYYTGDTRYMDPSVMELKPFTDVLLVPLSNRGVTMGIDDAVYFTRELKPHTVIPIHYDSPKDRGRVFPEDFTKQFQNDSNITARVLSFGESLCLGCKGNKIYCIND